MSRVDEGVRIVCRAMLVFGSYHGEGHGKPMYGSDTGSPCRLAETGVAGLGGLLKIPVMIAEGGLIRFVV